MLRKLASYPLQNGLALALREIGRIERTIFTLDWLLDPHLRQRVNAGLNKGEAKNTLARAVCFNRLGEIRDRTYEALLKHVAPNHINLTGDYAWKQHRRVEKGGFRPLQPIPKA